MRFLLVFFTFISFQLLAATGYISSVSGIINVVDTKTKLINATIPGLMSPSYMALSDDESTLYVSSLAGMVVIDTATNTITSTIGTSSGWVFTQATPDKTQVYASNLSSPGSVLAVETADNSTTAIDVNGDNPAFFGITPDSSRVYVPVEVQNKISVISTATKTVLTEIFLPAGRTPIEVTINPQGTKAYVVNRDDHFVDVIDIASNTLEAPINLGFAVVTSLHALINQAGTRLYVVSRGIGNGTLTVLDLVNKVELAVIGTGLESSNLAFNGDQSKIYVSNEGDGTVSVFDVTTNTVMTTLLVGTLPFSFALTPNKREMYVMNVGGAQVSIIDVLTDTVEPTVIPVAAGPIFALFANAAPSPVTVAGVSKQNGFFTQTEFFNIISWGAPVGITPIFYKIFRDEALTNLAGLIPATLREFVDHNRVPSTAYAYYIVAVTSNNEFLIGQAEVIT